MLAIPINGTRKFLDHIFANTSLGQRILYRLNLNNLRYVYYLITPNETMFETTDEVPNYNVQVSVWWLLFIIFEFCFLLLRGHNDRFALNDSITSISAGILSQCFKFGGRTIAIFVYDFIWNNFRLIENSWDSPLTWISCLFCQDFMYYLGHQIGFFWGIHTMHHSSEYFNYTTALRQAALQDVALAIYDILQAFFIPPSIFLVHRYFSEIYQFTLHTTLFDNYGALGIILNTPSHHRVHHGRNPYCIDRNYGAVFIIWDKMFGTFEPERQLEKPVFGIIKQEMTFNQIYLQASHRLKIGLKLAFFITTMQCLGAFFDRKVYSSYQEILRCTGVTAYYFYIMFDLTGVQPNRLFMMIVYISSSIFWSIYTVLHIDAVLQKNTGKIAR
ncbi:Alkylglycerol monooxygenase [Dirofilaria immitis]